jgi:predicted ATP-grasp superfamily ATP-dependent carboligase
MSFMSTHQPEQDCEVRRVLVYEFLSAGGIIAGLGPHEAAELRAQGTAMRDAMLADLAALAPAGPAAGALPGPPARSVHGSVQVQCVLPGDAAQAEAAALPVPGVQRVALPAGASHAALLCKAALGGTVVWAVAPETGGVLEALAQAVPPRQWLGCSADAIALAASKSATRKQLAAHGIAVPEAATRGPGAWVVKPDDGAGAAETRRHASHAAAQADARQRAGRGAACVVEPWVEGEALSLSLCCQGGEARLLSINRQHVQVDEQGTVEFAGVEAAAVDPAGERGAALAKLAAVVARALPGLRGYAGVDLVWSPGRGPVVIEVNPRLTTAYVGLSAKLGFNVAQHLLATLPGGTR